MIPKDWHITNLGEVAEVLDPQPDHRTPPEVLDGIPYIGVNNFSPNGEIDIQSCRRVSREVWLKQQATMSVNEGGIIFGKIGTIGMPKLLPKTDIKYTLSANVVLIKPKINVFFVLSLLKSDDINNQIYRTLHTTSQPALGIKKIRELLILIPPLPEQHKIAEILGVWDESIYLLEKLITAKCKLKQGLMQQLLEGKKRFKEFNDSEYSMVKLSEVSIIRRGASPRPIQDPKWFSKTGRGWIRIKDVTLSDTYLMETSQYLSELAVEKSVKVDPGDLIMSICATIGVPRIVGIPACIHDGFVVFREFEKYIDKFFLYQYISFISAKISDSGQPGTQKNINTSIVGGIKVPKFSLIEQVKIASLLSNLDTEISILEKTLAAYKQQKRGLMQQLLTGKKRLN